MASEHKAVRNMKIYGNLNFPVSFRHPTTDGDDRQWAGYIREVYSAADTCKSDIFLLRGDFISEISSEACTKTILPSLLSGTIDMKSNIPTTSSNELLINIFASIDACHLYNGYNKILIREHHAKKRTTITALISGYFYIKNGASAKPSEIYNNLMKIIIKSDFAIAIGANLAIGLITMAIANFIFKYPTNYVTIISHCNVYIDTICDKYGAFAKQCLIDWSPPLRWLCIPRYFQASQQIGWMDLQRQGQIDDHGERRVPLAAFQFRQIRHARPCPGGQFLLG